MSRGVNKVTLIGNLGANPEVKYMPNGDAVANVTVATSESWKDKSTGQQVDRVEWHRVTFFRRLAEVVGQYLVKGSKVYIEGKLQTRKWQKDGQDHYITEIIANEMQMLDSKGKEDTGAAKPATQQAKPQQSAPTTADIAGGDFDDDIPF